MTKTLRSVIAATYMAVSIAASGMLLSCGNDNAPTPPLVEQLNGQYREAAKAQSDGNYDKARSMYDKILHTHTSDPTVNDSLLPVASRTITQIMNTYQSQGKPEECIDYLKQLQQSKSIITGDLCRRDISVILAYAMSRTEAEKEAAEEMDRALRMPLHAPTPERLFRDYAYATAVYYCVPERKDDVNKYGRMALQQIRKCDNRAGESWITSILGMSYIRNGDLGNAVNIFKQSYDNAALRNDTLSMANTLNLMSNVMLSWNLYDYANDYATRAMNISQTLKDKNPKICSNILANKAYVMLKFGYADSCAAYLDKAQKYVKDMPYNSGNSDIELVRGELLAKNPATRAKGISMLRRVVANATSGISTKAGFTLARELLEHDEYADGETVLDNTIKTMSINTSPILSEEIYEFALDYYVTKGDNAKILQLARSFSNINRTETISDVIKQTAESIVKFKVQKSIDDSDIELMNSDNKRRFVIIYGVIALIIAAGIAAVLPIKHKHDKLRRQYAGLMLDNITTRMEQAARERQQTNLLPYEQSRLSATTEMPDFSIKEKHEKEYEVIFRNAFKKLYPHFMARLHTATSGISREEELLSMLIAIGLDNGQIKKIMCKSTSSIRMARYRLHAKMGTKHEDCLEKDLANMLDKT